MVFRFLFRFLLNDRVIERLSESYPIRRAAKWVVYFAHKAKEKVKNLGSKLEEKLRNIAQDLERKSRR
ncbi:unnamed protein product [Nesidiocoris tenuis]|uniref:Uncharacterized protein n=1 Tax=Nesidiocoris tenuis TaxID=355587 RepID=A0A6H5HKA3_9HEMI|nr:unnamed protein product [Nesidiocoris tenuis]CAB0016979.1 unnamed protein product [Nesidiocoris tenuis]